MEGTVVNEDCSFTENFFHVIMTYAIERMAVRKRQYTTIAIRNGIQRIDMQELVYMEVRDHELIYYTTGERYRIVNDFCINSKYTQK